MQTKDISRIVIEEVAKFFDTTFEEIYLNRKKRNREFVEPRQIIYWELKKRTNLSNSKIGFIFLQDHSTVSHAKKTINNYLSTDKLYTAEIGLIDSIIDEKIREFENSKQEMDLDFQEEHRKFCLFPFTDQLKYLVNYKDHILVKIESGIISFSFSSDEKNRIFTVRKTIYSDDEMNLFLKLNNFTS